MSDIAACDALSCDKKPDPRCATCRGTGRIVPEPAPKPRQGELL